jgi:SAM-dependent methyltransferase
MPDLFCIYPMNNDPWLDKWLDLIQRKSANGLVLELGCGSGWDTVELLSAGCKVIASDLSTGNLALCRLAAPNADKAQLDNGKPLPFTNASMDVIIASLSLHYFTWTVTMQIASELRRCLKADGILLARFNSTHDYNFGASTTEPAIEPNLYFLGTMTKRFFDEESVRMFLQGWDIQFLEENIIQRYEKPKSVWETMAVPAD